MPNTTGTITKTTFLKGVEPYKIREEFEVEPFLQTITFDAALVTSNDFDLDINGTAIATVTFATDSDTTMAAIADAIALHPDVKSAEVVEVAAGTSNDRVINVIPINQVSGVRLENAVVSSGASQAGVTIATVDSSIHIGQPVKLTSDGKVKPFTSSDDSELDLIGISIHEANGEELVTVALRGYSIIYAQAADDIVCGPVGTSGYDLTTGYNKVTDAAIDAQSIIGWAIDEASTGDVLRVIIKN